MDISGNNITQDDDYYNNLSNEELKEIWEDMQADYWIDVNKSEL